jgi:hypothetical protein
MARPDERHTLGSTNGNQAEPEVENTWLREEVTRLEARNRRAEAALAAMTESVAELRRGWDALKAQNADLVRAAQNHEPQPPA